MKHIKNAWLRIPRPVRAMVNILLILVLGFLFYFSLGCPTFTTEQAFRRAEKANLVGPSTIVDTLDHEEYPEFNKVIVGETDYGVVFYCTQDVFFPIFSYREKMGPVTVLAVPTDPFNWGLDNYGHSLPVYVFDDYPDAVRAELDLQIQGTYDYTSNRVPRTEHFDKAYALTADREQDGFFRFQIDAVYTGNRITEDLGEDGFAAWYFSQVCTVDIWSDESREAEHAIPATVRLYDKNGALIVEESLTIRSAAGEAHAKR